MNSYPMTSTTFIRNEIRALEKNGLEIVRYAVRRWDETLVDPADISERTRTHYLLTANILGLCFALAKEVLINPKGLYRGLRAWGGLLKNYRGGIVRHFAYAMQAIYLRQQADIDEIAHLHVHFSTNAAAVAMLCKIVGGPSFSFTAHGPDEFENPIKLSLMSKIQHASFVVAISDYCYLKLLGYASVPDRSKIKVVRCGLDLDEFNISKVDERNQTFVCVGRLCPQKGQVLIPKIASLLKAEFPNIRIVLVGDGESRDAIERSISELAVADIIQLKGWQPNAVVSGLIRDSRALLLPSYAEGLPIVIMEALALGRPVISTLIAAIPELVDDSCGWLAPAGDIEQLAAAIRSALLDPACELAKKGVNGRLRVDQFHNQHSSALALRGLFGRFVKPEQSSTVTQVAEGNRSDLHDMSGGDRNR